MSKKAFLALVTVLLLALFGASMAVLVLLVQADRMDQLERSPIVAPFTDVQGHWAESYIEQIRLAGLPLWYYPAPGPQKAPRTGLTTALLGPLWGLLSPRKPDMLSIA